MNISRPVIALLLTFAAFGFVLPAQAETDAEAAIKAVEAFNAGMSSGNLNMLLETLAGGGVQFTLRSLHEGVNPDKMTTPLVQHWSTIAPVIFGSTDSYTREVEVTNSVAHGDIATVWTNTKTLSKRKGKDAVTTNTFTEVYLLVVTPDGWKIAALADNRQATKLNN